MISSIIDNDNIVEPIGGNDTTVHLTVKAVEKTVELLSKESRDDLQLRLSVQPGGCSGLKYQLFFDDRYLDGDFTDAYDKFDFVVDKMSKVFLENAVIDFSETIEKIGFVIDNPNAEGSCSCGDSFS